MFLQMTEPLDFIIVWKHENLSREIIKAKYQDLKPALASLQLDEAYSLKIHLGQCSHRKL